VRLPPRVFFGVLAGLLFFGALFWAHGRDPFHRIWFKVQTKQSGRAECIAVLPHWKAATWPVVMYQYGSGGNLLGSGNELRQIAEMGLAAVGMDYNQTNEAASADQFSAVLDYVQRQKWADTNRIAWVGFSLGAQRQLAYLFANPGRKPKLLVRLGGGHVDRNARGPKSQIAETNVQPSNSSLPGSAVFIHAEHDEIFSLVEARALATDLRTNGVAVEFKVLPDQAQGFGPNRLQVFRLIGEDCVTHLKGREALNEYRSILLFQDQAKSLWLFWLPAVIWIVLWYWKRHVQRNEAARANPPVPAAPYASWEIGLRVLAAVLVILAVGQSALHLVPPRLPASARTLSLARGHIVTAKQLADFDFLSTNTVWLGKPLSTLLQHVELANYNRELINWQIDDDVYRQFVLSPQIDPGSDGELNWRRELWENFYPRIRKELSTESAAEIVVRFLRERVTVAEGDNFPKRIADVWLRQITTPRGFEAIYVAALRSAGVPARLDAAFRAEIWAGSAWKPAPRPVVEGL
jgi:dienelactone hydrolase